MNVSTSENTDLRTPKPENIFALSDENAIEVTSTASSKKTTQSETNRDQLFKSFVFEQSKCDRETEKCVAFWKSVMDKNLKPIKCSIIEGKKQYRKQSDDEEISAKCKEEIEKAIQAIHLKYKNLWSDMVKEVQKKKLNEVKLIGKTKCILCDTLASPEGCLCEKPNTEVNKEFIKKLNDWKSASVPLRKDEIKEDPVKTAREKVAIAKSYGRKYKVVDVRNEKKKSKLYENWRRPPHCKCNINDCTCVATEVATKATLSTDDVAILESKMPSLVEVHIQNLDDQPEFDHKSPLMIPSQLRYQSNFQYQDLSPKPNINYHDGPLLTSRSYVSANENVQMSHFAIKMIESNKYSETELLAFKSPDKKIETEEKIKKGTSDSLKKNYEDNLKEGDSPPALIPLEDLLDPDDMYEPAEPAFEESDIRIYLRKGGISDKNLDEHRVYKRGVSILKQTVLENTDYLAEFHKDEQQKSTPIDHNIVIKRDSLEMARRRRS